MKEIFRQKKIHKIFNYKFLIRLLLFLIRTVMASPIRGRHLQRMKILNNSVGLSVFLFVRPFRSQLFPGSLLPFFFFFVHRFRLLVFFPFAFPFFFRHAIGIAVFSSSNICSFQFHVPFPIFPINPELRIRPLRTFLLIFQIL